MGQSHSEHHISLHLIYKLKNISPNPSISNNVRLLAPDDLRILYCPISAEVWSQYIEHLTQLGEKENHIHVLFIILTNNSRKIIITFSFSLTLWCNSVLLFTPPPPPVPVEIRVLVGSYFGTKCWQWIGYFLLQSDASDYVTWWTVWPMKRQTGRLPNCLYCLNPAWCSVCTQ